MIKVLLTLVIHDLGGYGDLHPEVDLRHMVGVTALLHETGVVLIVQQLP